MAYQGWTNYETFVVTLWINNEEDSYNYLLELAERAKENNGDDSIESDAPYRYNREAALVDLSNAIKDWIEDSLPISDCNLASDLLNAALSEVNWDEIAESVLEDK